MRVGIGYDLHVLEKGRDLILGSVNIPYEMGLLGHSDADVLIHSIIDAILGAMGESDIGSHFPDTDNKFKDIKSTILLEKTIEIMKQNGYKIVNVDSNIICQKPKLMAYIPLMKKVLAPILEISEKELSIKAKTNEKVDATGEGRAISAQCVCLIEKV